MIITTVRFDGINCTREMFGHEFRRDPAKGSCLYYCDRLDAFHQIQKQVPACALPVKRTAPAGLEMWERQVDRCGSLENQLSGGLQNENGCPLGQRLKFIRDLLPSE